MAFIASIIPTAGVTFLFWLAIRSMLQADRRERLALARAERESAARTPPADNGS